MQTKICEMGQEIHTFSLRVHNGSEKKGKQGPEKQCALVFWIKDLNVFINFLKVC